MLAMPKLALPSCLVVLVACLTALGCATESKTKGTGEASVDGLEPAFLVQFQDDAQIQTVWIEGEPAHPKVVASRESALGISGESLWQWTTKPVDYESTDCQCLRNTPGGVGGGGEEALEACRRTSTVEVAVLESLSTGEAIVLSEVDRQPRPAAGQVSIEVRSERLPAQLESYARLPASVRAYVQSRKPAVEVVGWSSLPASVSTRSALLERFKHASSRTGRSQ